MFVPYGLVTAAANVISGLLLDRISPRSLLSAMLGLLCAALPLAVRVTTPELMLAYGGVPRLMQGSKGVLQAGVYAYYFGRLHLVSISGFASTLMVAGTAFGPLLFAVGYERFDAYAPTLTLALLAPLAVGIVALWAELRSLSQRLGDFSTLHSSDIIRHLSYLLAYPTVEDVEGSYAIIVVAQKTHA